MPDAVALRCILKVVTTIATTAVRNPVTNKLRPRLWWIKLIKSDCQGDVISRDELRVFSSVVDPLEYKGNELGTLAVDWRLLHLVQWATPAQSPPRYTKCNSQPINGQCTKNHCINGPLLCDFNVPIKALKYMEIANRFTVFFEPGFDTCRYRHRLALWRRMIVFALRLEEDGCRVHSRTWITHFAPEMCDRVAAVTSTRPQAQPTRAAFCRTRLVCSEP